MNSSIPRLEELDALVGFMPSRRDLSFMTERGWYRIPAASRPKRAWPPKWFAAYEGAAIRPDAGIFRIAPVLGVERRTREELFPGEPSGAKQGRVYDVLQLGPVRELRAPILRQRPRRFVFIPTSMTRIELAESVNDLFAESPLEDALWNEFKAHDVPAERQWEERVEGTKHRLDFALFCTKGKVDVETDGDRWHVSAIASVRDNRRDGRLQTAGWHVLRFTSKQIAARLGESLELILRLANKLGGFEDDGLVSRRFVPTSSGIAIQMNLLEEPSEYDAGQT